MPRANMYPCKGCAAIGRRTPKTNKPIQSKNPEGCELHAPTNKQDRTKKVKAEKETKQEKFEKEIKDSWARNNITEEDKLGFDSRLLKEMELLSAHLKLRNSHVPVKSQVESPPTPVNSGKEEESSSSGEEIIEVPKLSDSDEDISEIIEYEDPADISDPEAEIEVVSDDEAEYYEEEVEPYRPDNIDFTKK